MQYFNSIDEMDTILMNKIGLGIIIYIVELLSIKNLKYILIKLSSTQLSENLVFLRKKILSRLNKI